MRRNLDKIRASTMSRYLRIQDARRRYLVDQKRYAEAARIGRPNLEGEWPWARHCRLDSQRIQALRAWLLENEPDPDRRIPAHIYERWLKDIRE